MRSPSRIRSHPEHPERNGHLDDPLFVVVPEPVDRPVPVDGYDGMTVPPPVAPPFAPRVPDRSGAVGVGQGAEHRYVDRVGTVAMRSPGQLLTISAMLSPDSLLTIRIPEAAFRFSTGPPASPAPGRQISA